MHNEKRTISEFGLSRPAMIILVLMTMSFVAGCASSHAIVPDCVWAAYISFTAAEADAIVDCCPEVARQILTHNENFVREC